MPAPYVYNAGPETERAKMSTHSATIEWSRKGSKFTDNKYSREHLWRFDGGAVVPASSSPEVVRVPLSNPAHVDPEEAFVASVASCHMLWFLGLAAARGFTVECYTDTARGLMEKSAGGKAWIARVVLHPEVVFAGDQAPDDAAVAQLHHAAHDACFIANSIRSEVAVEGSWRHQPI